MVPWHEHNAKRNPICVLVYYTHKLHTQGKYNITDEVFVPQAHNTHSHCYGNCTGQPMLASTPN